MLRYSWTFLRDQLLALQQQHMQGNTIMPQVQPPLPPFFALQPAPSPLISHSMLPPPSEVATMYAPSEISDVAPSDGSWVTAPSEVSIHPSEMSDLQAPHLIQQSSQQPSSSSSQQPSSFAVFEEVGDDATSSSASDSSWRVRWHRRRLQELD